MQVFHLHSNIKRLTAHGDAVQPEGSTRPGSKRVQSSGRDGVAVLKGDDLA